MLSESIQLSDEKGGMSLFGGAEVSLDAEMDTQGAALEPCSATLDEVDGLGNFSEAEDPGIELTSESLLASGHGELNMVQAVNPKVR